MQTRQGLVGIETFGGFSALFLFELKGKVAIQVRKSQLRQNSEEQAAKRELQPMHRGKRGLEGSPVQKRAEKQLHCKDFALIRTNSKQLIQAKECFLQLPLDGEQSQPLPLNNLGKRV